VYNGQEFAYAGSGGNFYMEKCRMELCDSYTAFHMHARKAENLNSIGQQYKYCEHKHEKQQPADLHKTVHV